MFEFQRCQMFLFQNMVRGERGVIGTKISPEPILAIWCCLVYKYYMVTGLFLKNLRVSHFIIYLVQELAK